MAVGNAPAAPHTERGTSQLKTVRALKLYQSLGLWKVPLESVNTVGN